MSATLIFTSGGFDSPERALDGDRITIGRGADTDLVVPPGEARYVSRHHATLTREDGRWWLTDEGSTNGTFVNGQRITRSRLKHGDVVQFGRGGPEARFTSEDETVMAPPPESDATVLASPPSADRRGVPPSPPPLGEGSGATRYVNQLVEKAVGETRKGTRKAVMFSLGAAVVASLSLAGFGYATYFGNPERIFSRMSEEIEGSVFLIQTGFLVGDTYIPTGHGSGFAASDDGLIVTNKHVVFPELYSQQAACFNAGLERLGVDVDRARVVTVWKGGTTFRQSVGSQNGDRGLGWSSEHGALEIAARAPDNLGSPRRIACQDLQSGERFAYEWRSHLGDNSDIAVLRAATRLDPLPLATGQPEADDPIMVFGFPSGLYPQESNEAEPFRRTGEVIRVQETIQIDAPVLHGNSGGPLLNLEGEVVGITTRGVSDVHTNALKIDYARRVLERARATASR